MCTVTYIPLLTGAVFTSNRDESASRSSAMPPHIEKIDELELTYPKDPKSGGSWIAAKSNADVAVLLNGAFEKHEKLPFYRKSRGLILLEIIKSTAPLIYFEEVDLSQIENFTLILFTNSQLFECRWDGMQKQLIQKDKNVPHIWSSTTLYDEPVRKQREQWFADWLANETEINPQKIIEFHFAAGNGDSENNLVMQRKSGISTFSITSVPITKTHTSLHHHDLKKNKIYRQNLPRPTKKIASPIWEKSYLSLRIMGIKMINWEYWPMHIFYAPMYFYWLYLSVKARSLFFFSAANPLRKNAGFVLEKKSEVYAHIPQSYYPKTIVCSKKMPVTELKMRIDDRQLEFPLIAKPDMGERGVNVELVKTLADLVVYSRKSKVDFLVQEYIAYPFEIGIFYYRVPGELYGKISGIVGKELLTITGDGKSTIDALLKKEERHLLQLSTLKLIYGEKLNTVLPLGKEMLLVPYGNHCRGAKFIDLSYKINNRLTMVIDNLCQQVPEFYFGRLDLKFNSWEELYEGKNFSIIELNGAASEPTHIYDPSHSVFFAWKEIKRHWDLLYKISKTNATGKGLNLMGTAEGLKMLNDHNRYLKMMN